jgi:hypothetical protein
MLAYLCHYYLSALDSNNTGFFEEGKKYLDIKEKTRDKLERQAI